MRRLIEVSVAFRRHAAVISVVLLTVSALAPAISAEEVPVVVAIDTSRSLSPSELASMTSNVGDILAGLPLDTPIGLLAFDDSPEWIVEPSGTREAVESALADLKPAGNFTLLNDALFTAARKLPDGGVILLLTDGRDENSATTVKDVAGLCRTNHIRIVALGAGRRIDERALRRLALLTDGVHLGNTGAIELTTVTQGLTEAARATASEIEAARVTQSHRQGVEVPMAATQQSPSSAPQEISSAPWWLLPLLLVLIVAVLAALVMLWRWRRPVQSGPDKSGEWETNPSLLPDELSASAKEPTVDLAPALPMDERADELILDPSAFERLPFDGDLDTTSILDEQHILNVMEPGMEIRSFRLRQDRAFAVGRAPRVNTLKLDSKALSSQHFKIVPHEDGFAAVDLDSTNGTLVNGRRIRAHHLEAGDKIQAGDVEFEFKVILKTLL
ncbi:MAG: FHA domain-containing protein [Thermoanaerobaculales bacterium]|nr:FHA domain-containing protein [Thermoanaerobaculales bacterium]